MLCRVSISSMASLPKALQILDLSNSRISGSFLNKFLKSDTQLKFLDLCENQIHGEMTNLTNATQLWYLRLHSNNLLGLLPLISSNLVYLDLFNNSFSGSISHFWCYRSNETKRLRALSLGDNYLQG